MSPSNDPYTHDGSTNSIGSWQLLESAFQGAATHAALLPTNKVFAYGGSSLDSDAFDNPPPAEILDLDTLQTRTLSMQGVDCDLWCGGHTFLRDGRLLFVGGTSSYPPALDPFYGGGKQAYTFDPFSESWTRLPDMGAGRWYPTLIRLQDDAVLTLSGLRYRDPDEQVEGKNILGRIYDIVFKMKDRIVDFHEIYHLDAQKWDRTGEGTLLPLYPRLHLLPGGDVFYSGVFNTHYFTPGRFPSARWHPESAQWSPQGGPHFNKNREEGISMLLALRPPDYCPQVLIAGGGHHNLGRALQSILHGIGKGGWAEKFNFLTTVLDSVEFIDLGSPDPRWQRRSNMHYRRIHANGVLLPDGKVCVVGGMPSHANAAGELPVLPAEMYDPKSDHWTLMAKPQRPRVYHSTALLLPDARVISMGGNPQARVIERSIEIFSPPFLYQGERPVILDHPERITYAEPFDLRVDNSRQISQVVLMRPEVLTHVTNTDQRLLELEFKTVNGEKLQVHGPLDRTHMPHGYCLIFVLNNDVIPSKGKFLRVE
jgi:hypothetical protein